jgi:hypothetical protein
MTARNLDEATTIEAAVTKAVADAGLPDSSPIHAALVHDGEVFDGYSVCVPDLDGRSVTLQERIEQMRSEERWRREFPPARPVASRSGKPASGVTAGAILTPDRGAFADIVAGKTVVR